MPYTCRFRSGYSSVSLSIKTHLAGFVNRVLRRMIDVWQWSTRKPDLSKSLVHERLFDVLEKQQVLSVLVRFSCIGPFCLIDYLGYRELRDGDIEETTKYRNRSFRPRSTMLDLSVNEDRICYVDLDSAIRQLVRQWVRSETSGWKGSVSGDGYADIDVMGSAMTISVNPWTKPWDRSVDRTIHIATGAMN